MRAPRIRASHARIQIRAFRIRIRAFDHSNSGFHSNTGFLCSASFSNTGSPYGLSMKVKTRNRNPRGRYKCSACSSNTGFPCPYSNTESPYSNTGFFIFDYGILFEYGLAVPCVLLECRLSIRAFDKSKNSKAGTLGGATRAMRAPRIRLFDARIRIRSFRVRIRAF